MKYLLAFLLLVMPAMADEIQTKDGKKYEFTLLADQGDSWELTTPHGVKVTVKKADFDKLIPSGTKEVPLTGASFTFDKKRKLETVDLLTKLGDPKKDAISGTWKMTAKGLVMSNGEGHARLPVSYSPPEEYDLSITVERQTGDVDFLLGLVGGGKQFALKFDSSHGQASGLDKINGGGPETNTIPGTTVLGRFFEIKKPRTLTIMVRKEAFFMQENGKDLLAWKADWNTISLNPGFQVQEKNVLFLGVWGSTFQVSKMTLTAPKEKP
jgi:hypothetical protein